MVMGIIYKCPFISENHHVHKVVFMLTCKSNIPIVVLTISIPNFAISVFLYPCNTKKNDKQGNKVYISDIDNKETESYAIDFMCSMSESLSKNNKEDGKDFSMDSLFQK